MNQSNKIFPVHKVLNHIQITNMKVACLHNGIYVGSKTQRRIKDIFWAPGCQTIGESHSGDTETLWHDGYRFIRSRARSAFGNYSLPIRFNCLFELGAGGLEGLIGLSA